MRSRDIQKILVRGTTWLGDAVMTIPALQRLRTSFPQAHLTLLAPPRAAEIFSGATLVDEIFIYQRKEEGTKAFGQALQKLRREKFDLALLFQNAFEAALLTFLGGVKIRIGYDTQGRGLLLTHKLPHNELPRNRHQTHDYLDLVAEAEKICLGAAASNVPNNIPALLANAAQLQAATNLLQQFSITVGAQKLIALNAGATNSRAKCWPEERFAALADQMIEACGAHMLLIGAPSESENAERVMAQMRHPNSAKNLAGKTSIAELIGVLAHCDLVVTNDTGPAHVAAALGKATLTIFGPTNEFETAPLGRRSELLRADGIECARCMHRACPIDHRCMTQISVAEVAEKSFSLLGKIG